MSVATATGVRCVPQPPREVWRALAVLSPYCAVCDVTYVLGEDARRPGVGTTFVCASGRLEGPAPAGAPQGEIVEWDPPRAVATRLRLTPETWTTRIELERTADGGTRVLMAVTCEPTGGNPVVRRLQRAAVRRLVQRTVDAELAKVPAHVSQAAHRN